MEKYPKLQELSLAELESMYRLIYDGTYDGVDTGYLAQESARYGHEQDKLDYLKRKDLLREIRYVITGKIKFLLDV